MRRSLVFKETAVLLAVEVVEIDRPSAKALAVKRRDVKRKEKKREEKKRRRRKEGKKKEEKGEKENTRVIRESRWNEEAGDVRSLFSFFFHLGVDVINFKEISEIWPFSLSLSVHDDDEPLCSHAAGVVSKPAGKVEEAQEDDERVPVFGIAATVARFASLRSDELGPVRRRDVPYPCG